MATRTEGGGPVVDGTPAGAPSTDPAAAPTPFARRSSGPVLVAIIGISLAVAAFPIAGSLRAKGEVRRAYAEAHALVTSGEYEDALRILDESLDGGRRKRPRLEELAVQAAGYRADELEQSGGPAAALEWLRSQIDRRPYLEPLARSRVPRLDTIATLAEARTRGEPAETALRRLLDAYPRDATVAYTGAQWIHRDGRPDVDALPFYEIALDRGGYRGDPVVRALVEEAWQSFGPGARGSKDAHRIARAYYPDERVKWAARAFDSGNGPAFLNAMVILEETGDPRAKDPTLLALVRAMKGEAGAARETLLAETDPVRRKRFADLLGGAVKHQTMELAKLDEARALAKELGNRGTSHRRN